MQSQSALVFALVGKDRFLREESLAVLLGDACADVDPDCIVRVEGATATLATVLDDVRTPSLLGGRRAMIVDEADPFVTKHRQSLERYCANPAPCGVLVLLCRTLPKSTRLYKSIVASGQVVTCEMPASREMSRWITQRAKAKYSKVLSAESVRLLRDHVGDSPGLLDAELAKLTAYVGGRSRIEAADIAALTGHHREEKVFAVTDAMSSGDAKAALSYWDQVLSTDRAAPGRALAGLAWSVRRLLEARRSYEHGTSLSSLSRSMYTSPELLKRRLDRVTVEQLEQQQRDLLYADIAIKTGGASLAGAVERFIIKHAARSVA